MKTIIATSLLFVIINGLSQDIRNNNWGDSMEQVKTNEGEHSWEDYSTDTGTKYTTISSKIGGLDAVIGWYFVDDKLFMVAYVFTEEHQSRNLFIDDFDNIKEILDLKYGEKKLEYVWHNSLYRDDPEDYGTAISIGHLTIYTSRENDKMSIEHILKGDNYKIRHGVTYRSKEFSSLAGSKKRDKDLKDF